MVKTMIKTYCKIVAKAILLVSKFSGSISVVTMARNLSFRIKREKDSSYNNILEETTLLREIKDICNELNMLGSLAEDQKEVCDKLWDKEHNPKTMLTFDTPSEIIAKVEEMAKDAESVQKSIEILLDLKQKQANITEAKNSRKRSEETAKQGVAIMVFTLVTIVFVSCLILDNIQNSNTFFRSLASRLFLDQSVCIKCIRFSTQKGELSATKVDAFFR
jgi:hypothetical protein